MFSRAVAPSLAYALALASAPARAQAPAAPAPAKLAVMPLSAGEGVPDKTAASVTESVAAEVRRVPGLQIVTQQEISAVLSLEQQKQLLGCETDACVADLAGALGVDRIVTGNISKLGESWLLHLKIVDVRKVQTAAQSDRRHRGGSIDDVLDDLPDMVAELFPGYAPTPRRGGARAPSAPGPASAPAGAPASPPAWADEPADLGDAKPKLKFVTDGKGVTLAFIPFGSSDDPFFSSAGGDAKTFYAQRITGASRSGNESFDWSFWEPRAQRRYQASFGFRDGSYKLYCGEKPMALATVPDAEAKGLVDAAKFLQPRWRRHAFAIARDDSGAYYYVDHAREPEDNSDFRLFVGLKGRLELQELADAIIDGGGSLFVTPGGRVRFYRDAQDRDAAEWMVGSKKTPLTFLDVESSASMIYTSLGVYKGERLGTPCDGRF